MRHRRLETIGAENLVVRLCNWDVTSDATTLERSEDIQTKGEDRLSHITRVDLSPERCRLPPMKHVRLFLLCIPILANSAFGETPDSEWLVTTALLAAPEEERGAATVLGYDGDGNVITLREGSGSLICLADNPKQDGFSVASYHKDLEPYMVFGRERRAEGLNFQEVFDAREEAVKSGTLKMPDRATLSVLTGVVNDETGEIEDTYQRYVIYIPYATVESTGLPLEPATPGAPWIMNPGTHRAHIMVNPPK